MLSSVFLQILLRFLPLEIYSSPLRRYFLSNINENTSKFTASIALNLFQAVKIRNRGFQNRKKGRKIPLERLSRQPQRYLTVSHVFLTLADKVILR